MAELNCVVCQSPCRERYVDMFDDRYGFPGSFRLLECRSCGHISLDPQPSAETLGTLYTQYYPRKAVDPLSLSIPESPESNAERSSAFRWVPPGVRVLDIGCGFGESLLFHRSRGCSATGIEADENVQASAQVHGLRIERGLFDSRKFAGEQFDYVTLDQVIEHVSDPLEFLKDIARVLPKNGHIVLSTPNAQGWGARIFGRKWINWHVPYHLHGFNSESLRRVAEKAGYNVELLSWTTNPNWLVFQLNHNAGYPSSIGRPSRFWSSTEDRSTGLKMAFRLIDVAKNTGLFTFVTRVMDGLRFGDNMVAILRKID